MKINLEEMRRKQELSDLRVRAATLVSKAITHDYEGLPLGQACIDALPYRREHGEFESTVDPGKKSVFEAIWQYANAAAADFVIAAGQEPTPQRVNEALDASFPGVGAFVLGAITAGLEAKGSTLRRS